MEALLGSKDGFLVKRIKSYDTYRNFPTKPTALSNLSPYLHFGHISAQRCALEAKKRRHLSLKVPFFEICDLRSYAVNIILSDGRIYFFFVPTELQI
jgi:deoxyribodipyrimidine photolyase